MFIDYSKIMSNQLQAMIEANLPRSFMNLNISPTIIVYSVTQHATNSSATPAIPLENLNLVCHCITFIGQNSPAPTSIFNREMMMSAIILNTSAPEPLTTIPPSSIANNRTNELAGFVPPYVNVPYSAPPQPAVGNGIPYGPINMLNLLNKLSAQCHRVHLKELL